VDFPFVRNSRPTEQRIVFVKENNPYFSLGQRESDAAALQSATQDAHKHCGLCPFARKNSAR
jgi:hypothetical protein